MFTVYKYALPAPVNEIKLPESAQVLTTRLQRGEPVIWVLCDPSEPVVTRKFFVVPTGSVIPQTTKPVYIGTVETDLGFIFHVFEVVTHAL